MTQDQAIGYYFKHNQKAQFQITKLKKWDPSKDIKSNSDILKIKYADAKQFASLYKLKYKKLG